MRRLVVARGRAPREELGLAQLAEEGGRRDAGQVGGLERGELRLEGGLLGRGRRLDALDQLLDFERPGALGGGIELPEGVVLRVGGGRG